MSQPERPPLREVKTMSVPAPDNTASDFHFLAIWEESIAFMEREGASWDLEPEKVLARV